jgi:hypothetical protein
MVEYHSYEQAPHLDTAKKEIFRNFLNCDVDEKYQNFLNDVNKTDEFKNNMINEAFMNADVLDESKREIKYSYSGWYIFGRSEVMNTLSKIIVREFNKT